MRTQSLSIMHTVTAVTLHTHFDSTDCDWELKS